MRAVRVALDNSREQSLLLRHPIIQTENPERLRDALFGLYNVSGFRVGRDSDRFFAEANRVQLLHVGLGFIACSAELELKFNEVSAFRHQICLAGGGDTTLNGKQIQLSADDSCLIPPDTKIATRLAANYRHLVLRIDPDALYRKLESLTGISAKRRFEFDSAASFRTPRLQNLRRMVVFLVSELDSSTSQFSNLALAEFEQVLMISFLCGHRHNFSDLLERPPESAAPWQVRLAEAYIEANWNKPITVEAISQAIGVSVRSIFKSFKDKRGCSPMTFAKTIRLTHAKEMLHRAEPSTSVTGVAFECGFHNLGHFAKEYRVQFGELPSETLLRARGKSQGDTE